ncbi:SRPBCC family protein [Streptomyces sp. NBC_01190]|uniref:SRPBCC family protein n=1 Tax=Streptomyces sp. NBC_01190 TaxID=2903767 RepID=UPI00386521B0|nr:SRPBCC family protein [Streptomyces sp. NBC_01190]
MTIIEESVDVRVPVRMAYNQWTQFESFPRFMDGVLRVDRPKSTLTHWVTRHCGVTREFDAEIVAQTPDERVAWRGLGTARHSGTVTFQSFGDERTRVTLRVDFTPRGVVGWLMVLTGAIRRRVRGNLRCFKLFIEGQGRETGAWRGVISESRVRPDSGQDPPHVPDWPSG